MDLEMIGLGRMGGNMARRLAGAGHRVVGWARHEETVRAAAADGVIAAASLEAVVAGLELPRASWVMVPAGAATEDVVRTLGERLAPGDVWLLSAMRRELGGHREATRAGGGKP